MAKEIPPSFIKQIKDEAGSGQPDRLRTTRGMAFNNNYLYGNKAGECQWSRTIWNATGSNSVYNPAGKDVTGSYDAGSFAGEFYQPYHVTGSTYDIVKIGNMFVPDSLSSRTRLAVVGSYSGDNTAGKLWMIPNVSSSQALQVSISTTEANVTVPVTNEMYSLYLISNPDVANTKKMRLDSLTIYWPSASSYNGQTKDWQNLKQTYIDDDKPDSSYLYKKMIGNQANIISEASSTLFSVYTGVPWTNSTTLTTVGDYRFFTEKQVTGIQLYLFARYVAHASTTAAAFKVLLNGNVAVAETAVTSNWALYGPYNLNDAVGLSGVTTGYIQNLVIQARKTTGDTGVDHGVQIAGVYCWEHDLAESQICPTGDTLTGSFGGSETSVYLGSYPILANYDRLGFDGNTDRVSTGKNQMNKDTVWLKKHQRRILINDWRHRTGNAKQGASVAWHYGGNWFNGVGNLQREYDANPAWSTGGILNGTVLARHYMPTASGSFNEVDVWLHVSTFSTLRGSPTPNESWELKVTGATTDIRRQISADLTSIPSSVINPLDGDLFNFYINRSTEWVDGDPGSTPHGPELRVPVTQPTAFIGPFRTDLTSASPTPIIVEGKFLGGLGTERVLCLNGVYIRHVNRVGSV